MELDWLALPVCAHANDGARALNVADVGEAQLGKRFWPDATAHKLEIKCRVREGDQPNEKTAAAKLGGDPRFSCICIAPAS
jgi:hypothetical protein